MVEKENAKNSWQTMTRFITGLAMIITAVSGFIVAIGFVARILTPRFERSVIRQP